MIDCNDMTIIIPFKYDSIDRLENLRCILSYLQKHIRCNIIIGESGSDKTIPDDILGNSIGYIFYKDDSSLFHKTKLLNILIKESETDIICSYDCDMIIPINRLVDAYNLIKNNTYEFVIPFNRLCLYVKDEIRKSFIDDLDFDKMILKLKNDIHTLNLFGGMLFFYKESFIKCGLEDERYIGWGFEDEERVNRIRLLNGNIRLLDGPIYHLDHYRDNSKQNIFSEESENNKRLFLDMFKLSRNELLSLVKNWDWCK